jgi:hypothetical protein
MELGTPTRVKANRGKALGTPGRLKMRSTIKVDEVGGRAVELKAAPHVEAHLVALVDSALSEGTADDE